MLKRLRIKFICVNMGIVFLMLCVIFALTLTSTRQNLERESLELMQSVINQPSDIRQPRFLEPGEAQVSSGLPYIVVTMNGPDDIDSVSGDVDEDRVEALVEAARQVHKQSGVLSEYEARFLKSDSSARNRRIVFMDISSELSTIRGLVKTSLVVGLTSLILFFFLSLFLAWWAIRPVEQAWRQQKQFVSDASHELKTPLTVIMTNAELLQSPDYDEAAKARFSANILTMTKQMRGLVEGLLELARVDNGVMENHAGEVDFSAVCAEAILPFEPLCFERGLTIASDITPGVQLRGSGNYLRQMVEILLDNARKYAREDTGITVRLIKTPRNHCLLSVADVGDPIAPEDIEHLFERFYRADKSRSRDGSYGLGLSIAEKIVEGCGGKIWAESEKGINTFFVSLPVAS